MNFAEFDNKYRDAWRAGNITKDSVEELRDILCNLNIDFSISSKIYWTAQHMILLLIRYRFDKGCQSVNWIEPIRMDNWSLNCWLKIDPNLINSSYDYESSESAVWEGFYNTYNPDNYVERVGDEFAEELAKEFNLKNLADIDYIENYLKTYASTDKVRRYLQII